MAHSRIRGIVLEDYTMGDAVPAGRGADPGIHAVHRETAPCPLFDFHYLNDQRGIGCPDDGRFWHGHGGRGAGDVYIAGAMRGDLILVFLVFWAEAREPEKIVQSLGDVEGSQDRRWLRPGRDHDVFHRVFAERGNSSL